MQIRQVLHKHRPGVQAFAYCFAEKDVSPSFFRLHLLKLHPSIRGLASGVPDHVSPDCPGPGDLQAPSDPPGISPLHCLLEKSADIILRHFTHNWLIEESPLVQFYTYNGDFI